MLARAVTELIIETQPGGRGRETKRLTNRQRDTLGIAWAFESPKPISTVTHPPTRPHLPIIPKKVPPTGNQAFTYISLRGQFSFKPHLQLITSML